MEKLQLHEIAGYLSCKLHIKHNEGARLIICGAFKKHNRDDFFTYSLLNWDRDVKSIEAKPILRPMSDLIKTIAYNGINIVLAKVLWSISAEEEEKFDVYGFTPDYWKNCLSMAQSDIRNMDYGDVQEMLKHHFDIHNLIGRNLAIDINTLNKS